MRIRFNSMRAGMLALLTATCLSSSLAVSQERAILFWPNREPMQMGIDVPAEHQEPLEIELSLPTPFGLTVGQPVALGVSTEGNADGVTYRAAASAAMPGLIVNASTGSIEGIPDAPAGTNYSFAIEAIRNGEVVSTSAAVRLTLRAPLEIDVAPDDIELTVGESLQSSVVGATGGDQDSISWSLENAPDWLEVVTTGPGTAVLRQVDGRDVTETSMTSLTLIASDADGRHDSWNTAIEVSPVAARAYQTISAGYEHTCGLTMGGTAYCWGAGGNGRLGNDSTAGGDIPVAVAGGLSFSTISAGYKHTCGITSEGNAYCWGDGASGRLGHDSSTGSNVPVAVAGGLSFADISAGYAHTCGLTTGGAAYCWGAGANGILGNGSTGSSNVPVAVAGGLSFADILASDNYTCGLTTGGAAYCWGAGTYGRLGNDSTAGSNVPVAVAGGLLFSEISPGYSHTCGVTTGGAAYCWGAMGHGGYGQLGNDGIGPAGSNVPVAVDGGLSFAGISASYNLFTCGVTTERTTYCWGTGTLGELGNGSTSSSNVPLAVAGGLSFAEISAGYAHSCGVTTEGAAYCWGYGTHGELGNGGTASSSIPVAVVDYP